MSRHSHEASIEVGVPAEQAFAYLSDGHKQGDLRPLVWSRVVPGPEIGLGAESCLVTLVVWRGEGLGDDTWELLSHTFAAEVHMIKGRLELGFRV
jgi:hypothetical protein